MPFFLMMHLHIAVLLALITLCISTGLILVAKSHTGFVAGLGCLFGWIVMLFSLLALICTLYCGIRMWHNMPPMPKSAYMEQMMHKEGVSDLGSPGQPGMVKHQ